MRKYSGYTTKISILKHADEDGREEVNNAQHPREALCAEKPADSPQKIANGSFCPRFSWKKYKQHRKKNI